jgi:hypothetical protein
MRQRQSVNIRQISRNRAEQVSYYRFLENEQVNVSELVQTVASSCQQQVSGLHVLSISDTSEINLKRHAGRIKPEGLGVVGNNEDIGFFIHPTLVLNAETGLPLGLSDIQVWTRDADRRILSKQEKRVLAIEEKESFKWLLSAERSERCLSDGGVQMITHIGDRESDLYEEWATVPNTQNHVLVRLCKDRGLLGQKVSIYEYLAQQPSVGNYSVEVFADPRIGQTGRIAREAWLSVKMAAVSIKRPHNLSAAKYPKSVDLYALEVKELHPPAGQTPVHWRLLTTHRVVTLEQALQVIHWYRWRWRIEQLFATIKQTGLNVEASQLESARAIQRLTVMSLSVALRTLQLLDGRDAPDLPAALAFTSEQQDCLAQLEPTLQGSTKKQQNPYPRATLPWATWLIARLGGWSGYRSQRPPGIPTLIHGLKQFEAIFLGWKLTQTQLVCTR